MSAAAYGPSQRAAAAGAPGWQQDMDEMAESGIASPELLHIRDGLQTSYGAHQIWYRSWIKRMSGCGPTAASNLLWYLRASRPELCRDLFAGDAVERSGMLRLMEAVWHYVTPGIRGVDRAAMLADGGVRYGRQAGVALRADILEIPPLKSDRPGEKKVSGFLAAAFARDLPVAFLNLSNGAVRNLDNWHWVTLVSVNQELLAEMYDQGRRQMIDVALWLDTTAGGGAFVTIEPDEPGRTSGRPSCGTYLLTGK